VFSQTISTIVRAIISDDHGILILASRPKSILHIFLYDSDLCHRDLKFKKGYDHHSLHFCSPPSFFYFFNRTYSLKPLSKSMFYVTQGFIPLIFFLRSVSEFCRDNYYLTFSFSLTRRKDCIIISMVHKINPCVRVLLEKLLMALGENCSRISFLVVSKSNE
jgi:hypothetical protein